MSKKICASAINAVLSMLLMVIPVAARAVEFEENSANKQHVPVGVADVFVIDGEYYAVVDLPVRANRYEFKDLDSGGYKDVSVSPGEEMTEDEAKKVIVYYFERSAFEAGSVKIRGFKFGDRKYARWCSNPSLFGCLYWEYRAGTFIAFEANGKNRSGGMTGYQPRAIMIRKHKPENKQ